MSRIEYQTYTNVALNATGIASAVAWASGGYVLTASGAADNLGHLITFYNISGNSHTGQTITFTGTDENGNPQTETLTGPGATSTITTAGHYVTLTKVTASATTGADTFNIGWTADAVGAHLHPELDRVPVINIEVFCLVPTSGPTYGLDYTSDATPTGLIAASWLAHPVLQAKTVTADGQITVPIKAMRLHFTVAGRVNMTVIEPFRA